ncbi:hypothetical protein I4U23_003850 [Adineta vaga]|nr:hypothetical protein I4U23_003850 [Adineta vaga]
MPLPLSSAAPTFVTEDIQCSIKHPMFNIRLTSSCVYDRQNLLRQIILSHTPNSFSETCWSAFQCFNQTCKQIIDDTCPDLLFVPYEAFIFGHIHLLYLKKSIMNLSTSFLPQYICYNDQLCHGFLSNVTLLKFNNITCRRFEDFPLKTPLIPHKNWFDLNLRLLYDQLHHCNTILYDKPFICNSSTMYRCIKSSKCISQYQLCDDIYDCDYKDDEQCSLTNDICSIYDSISLFKCPLMNKCISRKKVQNRYCDCGFDEFGLCEDESSVTRHIREHISFPTICDGFTELKPVLIDGRNETDETECTYWQCDNIYTRCNGIWNCLNGADEVNCHSFIECPLNHHLCISPSTYQFICLPLEKAHDGNIDCVAGIDEPKLCRMNNYKVHDWQFYCQDNPIQSCTSFKRLCSEKQNCTYGNHDVLCINSEHMSSYLATCDSKWVRNATKLQKFLCRSFNDQNKNPFGYFSLMNFQQSIEHITPKTRMIAVAKPQYAQHCHRGLPLRVWLTNNDKNLTEKNCLCPPSFYGDICQYQNQRVSLTLKFETYSNSRQTLFAMIVSLIDDSYERIVHSYEQFTYLYIGHCQKKFNIYLLYSARPKSLTRNYSIHIDIYEKISLVYRSSHIIPLQHPFLPVHRIALQLQIPNSDISSQHCSIHQHCIHGQCMSYINDEDNSSFCQCYSGWSGKYCTIRQSCTCSSESLCIGMTATNRSICVCPRNRWGPRCLLQSTSCPSNTCLNHGQCISIDDNIISDQQFICICLKGFRGKRCEIIDYKLIISFQEKIPFPQPILVHFFEIRNDSSPINGSTFRTVLPYQKTITIYWSHPFHIVLLERSDRNLYLISVEHIWNQSTSLVRTMKFSNRCQHINEVFNKTITHLHLLRRIKYYHLPCQSSSPIVSCFYDDTHFCLCNHFNHHRVANCFEFNFTIKHNCYDQSSCENQAQCIQDRFVCPQTSICVCPKCFYGTRCQFSSNLFDLSLDTILSYHIQPHLRAAML